MKTLYLKREQRFLHNAAAGYGRKWLVKRSHTVKSIKLITDKTLWPVFI